VGFPVFQPDAEEAQQEAPELEPDWYQFYCQAIAAGVDPREFGDYTYSQIMAKIDAFKLANYNVMHFNVLDIVSNMSDESVSDSLHGRTSGSPARGRLIQQMMKPYSPSFMLDDIAKVMRAKPIEGLSAKAAEGIMQAIERKLVPDEQWLTIHKLWSRIHATARGYRPGQ